MAETAAIALAMLCLIALIATLGVFCHGLWARHQMTRYKRIVDRMPAAKGRSKPAPKLLEED